MKIQKLLAAELAGIMGLANIIPVDCLNTAAETAQTSATELSDPIGDMTIESTNSFGSLLASELTEKQAEQLANNGCNIFSVEMDGNEATVSYQTVVDCTLVIGIYDESGTTLYATGTTEVTPDERETVVTIETDEMPQYFYVKGYLADSYLLNPLCTVYECPNYTQEMQEFFAKTVDDFDEQKVINFDDDKTNNFAVYGENTIVIPENEGYNIVTSADDENSVYVIENADENVLSLQNDDIFAYTYGDNELLIIKIDTIDIDGTTVTITGADTEMNEVFDYVRIDAEEGMDSAEIEPLNGAEVVEQEEVNAISGNDAVDTRSSGVSVTKEVKKNFVDWQPFKGSTDSESDTFPSFSGEFKVNGSVSFSASVDVEFYVTLRQSYLSLEVSYRGGVELKINAKGQLTYPLCNMQFSPIPGLYIGITPAFVIRMTAEITLSGDWSGSFGIAADSQKKKIRNISEKPKYSLSAKAQGTCFVGFDLQPKITVITKKLCKVSATAEAGIEIDATLSKTLTSETETDVKKITRIHDCKACVDGDMNFVFSMKFEVKLPFISKLELHLLDESYKIGDFYWSIDRDEYGLTECPHQLQRVTLKVQDSAGHPVSGAELAFSSDTEVKIMELPYLPEPVTGTLTTDENGEVSLFLGMGETNVNASKESYGVTEKSFRTSISKLNIFRLNDEIRTDGIIVLPAPRHTFKVAVTDKNGKHVQYARFSCNAYTTPEYTNSDGQAALRLPDGDYTFTVEKNGEISTFHATIQGEDAETEIVLGEQDEPVVTEPVITEAKNRLSLGGYHSAYVTEDGSLYTWGWNYYGQLGDGTTTHRSTPVKIMDNVVAVSLGEYHSAAITADGSLYTWGVNEYGQLGDGTTEDKLTPVKIMDNVTSVSLGYYHSAAITEDGSLYTWGSNDSGELGDDTFTNKSTPVKIMDNVASVSLGYNHSAAITLDGSLYIWGDNYYGQLEEGISDRYKSTPVKIMDNVASISLGFLQSAAITTDGSLYTWGTGYVTMVKIMDNVAAVNLWRDSHSAAITTDGSLYMWGYNEYGQLGDGTTIQESTPLKIMENVVAVSLGWRHSAAITKDGRLYTWGINEYGQLGNGENGYDESGELLKSTVPIKIIIPTKGTETVSLKTCALVRATSSETPQTSLTGLEPDTVYNYYILYSDAGDRLLTPANIQYITQFVSSSDGTAEIDTGETPITEDAIMLAVPAVIATDEPTEPEPTDPEPTEPEPTEPADILLGDVNLDNTINAGDAAMTLSAAAAYGATGSYGNLTATQIAAADIDGNDAVNASDAAYILQYAAIKGANGKEFDIRELVK